MVCGKTVSYTQKLLQKSFGPVYVDVGDAAVSAQHAVHCGGNLPPVVLGVGVKGGLIFCDVTHPASSSQSERDAQVNIPPYFHSLFSCFHLLFLNSMNYKTNGAFIISSFSGSLLLIVKL